MPKFDVDAQRGLICLFGLVALTMESVAFYLTGHTLPDILTGIFGTMAVGPVVTSTADKYRQSKREEDLDSPPPPRPPSSSPRDRDREEAP
jgi:hypothetical protein